MPPDVQVQHVDLREAIQDGSASEGSEVLRLAAAQNVISGVREGDRGSVDLAKRKVQSGGPTEPHCHFVPRTTMKHPFLAGHDTRRLKSRPEIGEIATREREQESPVVCTVIRKTAVRRVLMSEQEVQRALERMNPIGWNRVRMRSREAESPQVDLNRETVVIVRLLNVGAVRIDLMVGLLLQQSPPFCDPGRTCFNVRQDAAGTVEGQSF